METALYVLGWTFADGSVYCVAWHEAEYKEYADTYEVDPPVGMWRYPFPNVQGDSFAYGMWEGLSQSDIGPMLKDLHGEVVYLQCWWSDLRGRRVHGPVS